MQNKSSVLACVGLEDSFEMDDDLVSVGSEDLADYNEDEIDALESQLEAQRCALAAEVVLQDFTTPVAGTRADADADGFAPGHDEETTKPKEVQNLMQQYASLDDHVLSCNSHTQKRKGLFSPPDKTMRKTVGGGGRMDVDVSRFVKELAVELNEPKVYLLRKALDLQGLTVVREIMNEVQMVEAEGGQWTAEGDRKRTPGGVFWNLLKHKVSKEEFAAIFAEEKQKEKERNRKRQKERNLKRELTGSGKGTLAARLGAKSPSQTFALSVDTPSPSGTRTAVSSSPARAWASVVKALET